MKKQRQAQAIAATLERQIVDGAWIRGRYGVSLRFIDRHIADGSLRPFNPREQVLPGRGHRLHGDRLGVTA